MYFRNAITFLGDEWARLHRMIEALEREAEDHHKRHTPANSRKGPANSNSPRPVPSAGGNATVQQNPWGF